MSKMLAILLRARLSALLHTLFSGNKRKRTIPMIVLFSILFLYVGAAVLFLFGALFALLLPSLLEADALHAYFAIGGVAAFLVMLLGNIYFTKNQLYTADDNEFLLSMPIPPRAILLSRLILVILTSFLFEAGVALPMLAVYLFFAEVRLSALLSMLLVFLVLPFLTQSISSLLAYLIARLSVHIRKKSLLTTILSLLFLGAYYIFTFGLEEFFDWLSVDISPLIRFVDGTWPLAMLGHAMAGRVLPLLGVILLSTAITLLTLRWLSHSFIRTALDNKGAPSVRYRERTVAKRSPLYALTVRELRHLGASSGWMLNAGLGLIITLIPPIYFLVDNSILTAAIQAMPILEPLLPAIAATATAACLSMVFFSASTVSLEGRTLWLVRSLPIPTETVLYSKILMHAIPTAPVALLSGILFAIALGIAPLEAAAVLLFVLAYTLASATLGLVANLLLPKMEWKNELVPIKQGSASFLAMLGGAVCASLSGGISILLSLILPVTLALLIGAILLVGITAALLWYIRTGGVRQFESL